MIREMMESGKEKIGKDLRMSLPNTTTALFYLCTFSSADSQERAINHKWEMGSLLWTKRMRDMSLVPREGEGGGKGGKGGNCKVRKMMRDDDESNDKKRW